MTQDIDREARIVAVFQEGFEWQVRYQGSYWKARSTEPHAQYEINSRVYVVGCKSLVLLIRSIPT